MGAEPIGQIIRLDEGFVAQMYGRDYVARNPGELGKLVARLAGKRPRKVQVPTVAPTAPVGPISVENSPEPALDWAKQRSADDRNLSRLITARLAGKVTGEDVMRGAEELVLTYSMQEVARIILDAEEQYFKIAPPSKRGVLGTRCACPGCGQNQSYPNEKGMCVSCYQDEHLHPGGPNGYAAAPGARPEAEVIYEEPPEDDDDDDDEDDEDTAEPNGDAAAVPHGDDLHGDGPGDAGWENSDASDTEERAFVPERDAK